MQLPRRDRHSDKKQGTRTKNRQYKTDTMKKIIILTLAAVLAAALQTDACTGITLRVPDRGTVVARTIEWGGSDLNSRYVVVPRGYREHSMLPYQKKGRRFRPQDLLPFPWEKGTPAQTAAPPSDADIERISQRFGEG